MPYSNKSFVAVLSDEPGIVSPGFGPALRSAMEEFENTRSPQTIRFLRTFGTGDTQYAERCIAGGVVSLDTAEAVQVLVVSEGGGERVTKTSGNQAAIDALVDVLRGHGYTCIRRQK